MKWYILTIYLSKFKIQIHKYEERMSHLNFKQNAEFAEVQQHTGNFSNNLINLRNLTLRLRSV